MEGKQLIEIFGGEVIMSRILVFFFAVYVQFQQNVLHYRYLSFLTWTGSHIFFSLMY